MLNKRKQGRINRNTLEKSLHFEYSKKICQNIQPFITDKSVIMIYNCIDNEVDVSFLKDKNKTVLYPRIEGDIIVAVDPEGFENGSFGVYEPKGKAYLGNIDAVIVPMCAFDEKLNRLGFGKGYYDKFLYNLDCLKIGVAFNCQKTTNIIEKETDVKMDIIVTENEIIRSIK